MPSVDDIAAVYVERAAARADVAPCTQGTGPFPRHRLSGSAKLDLAWRQAVTVNRAGRSRSLTLARRGASLACRRLSCAPALVAQRIEHLTTDQKVGGSSPSERAPQPQLNRAMVAASGAASEAALSRGT